ncbi:carboxypeptidase-like regulatory domain-containing protein [Deinococcus sp. KNUC1210]|uniref:carboxypeptidase-like regulatory domain-containing protein n=1 Tax=Deinococcus sp. KNUC1210 TaxID=2917691 RepID=UPI001EF11328|nr:carboxypeptidase-like regulatory domain-containing protein [Deinococcus sp. KNUC1210]ULH16057.1 carboxypeptidase-like regulatory domain-containing protein [Deinococcus sp. KNUC1210]
MKKSASAAVFLAVALALGACGPSNPDPVTPPATDTSIIGSGSVSVQGYVQSQNGGAAVAGSTVTVTDASGTAIGTGTTTATGQFTLKVNPGAYNLSFAKSGYAGSVVESFPVTAGMTAPLNVIEKVAFDPSFSTAPPKLSVTSLNGTTETAFPTDPANALSFNASTGLTLHYVATSPAPTTAFPVSLSPVSLYAAVGLLNTPGSGFMGSRAIASNDPKNSTFDTTLKVTGASIRGVRGATYLNLVAYDFNYNRINKYIPIVINDDAPDDAAGGLYRHLGPRRDAGPETERRRLQRRRQAGRRNRRDQQHVGRSELQLSGWPSG